MTQAQTGALRQRMLQDLQLAGLSERTQEAYLRAVRKLVAHCRRAPDQLSEPQVRDYLLDLKNDKRFSPSALKIAHSGIKSFYSHTVVRDWATDRNPHLLFPATRCDHRRAATAPHPMGKRNLRLWNARVVWRSVEQRW